MRKVLEDLIFTGKIQETFDIFGMQFEIRTLTSQEIIAATAETAQYDTFARVNALKVALMGKAIVSINNIKFTDASEGEEFVSKLQLPLLDAIYEKYEVLQEKQDTTLSGLTQDEIKN